jgi:hypothetical protein
MSEHPSATIIAFPRPPAAPAAEQGQARLLRALAALEAALAEQRAAVATWRDSLAALRGAMLALGASLTAYRDRLDDLGTGVDGLHLEARRLEAWAEATLASG